MKHVLLICFYYPPLLGPGGVRPSKLKKYLPEFNWEVDVLTVGAPNFPADPEDAKGIYRAEYQPFMGRSIALPVNPEDKNPKSGPPPKASFRSKCLKKAGWSGFTGYHYPGLEEGWVKNAITEGSKLLSSGNYDAIISSFPPAGAHRVASHLAQTFTLPWIADYRDEWSSEKYFAPRGGLFKLLDQWIEKKTLKHASHLVAVSQPMADAILSLHKNKPMTVIQNGFDPNEYPPPTTSSETSRLSLCFTGQLSPKNHLKPLLEGLHILKKDRLITSETFELRFIGTQREGLKEECRSHGVEDLLRCDGWVNYEESLQVQVDADFLFFPYWKAPGSDGVCSSKLYAYIGAQRPVLFVGPHNHIVANLLHTTGAGETGETGQECADVLKQWIQTQQRTGRFSPTVDPDEIKKCSRIHQAEAFADILNHITTTTSKDAS